MSGNLIHPADRWRPSGLRPKRPLYMMVKPPAEPLSVITALSRLDRSRSAGLLHVTMLPFDDLANWPAEFLPLLIEMLNGFEADAFDVQFDRIVERWAVTLRSSKPQSGARAVQKQLAAFLKARGFPFFGGPPDPHLTISYRGDGKGNEAIAPITWTVEEIILVESVHGKSTHVEHGRWPLRRRLL